MQRQILHVDVNNAFLSWLAVYKLKMEKNRHQRQGAVIGGDETRRAGIVLAKSQKLNNLELNRRNFYIVQEENAIIYKYIQAIIKYIKNIQINYIICYQNIQTK